MNKFYLLLLLVGITSIGFGQINSIQDGDWDDPNTWDCACVPDVFSAVDINVNHDITVTNDINLNLVTIFNGASVTINSGVTVFIEEDFANTPLTINAGGLMVNNGTLDLASFLFFTPCAINGTLQSSSTINLGDPTLLVFNSGSVYQHNYGSGGDIPLALWDANSTVQILGLGTASPATPNNLNQTFGNFEWNTPSMGVTATFSLGGNLQNVLGNLRFISTGTTPRVVRLASGGSGYNLTIGGDLIIDGGTVFLTNGLSSSTTISVDGDFSMSGGNLGLAQTNANNTSLGIKGNFTKTGGTLNSGGGAGLKNIVFEGNGSAQNYSVNALTAAFNFIVQSGALLNLGVNPLITSGTAGTFTLNGIVRLGSLNGTGAIQGNIPMTTRTFNSGSRIIYSGSGVQFMGTAQPSTSGVTTDIDNSSGVSLVTNVTIGGNLILTSGNLSISNSTLTLIGGFTPNSNFLNVLSTSSLSIGGSGAFGTLTTTGSTTLNNFTLNRVSGGTITLGTDLTIAGTFTQNQGDIILNGRTLTISGPYARANGSFSIDAASSVTIDGSGALPTEIAFSGSQELNTLIINRSSSTVGTSSSFTVTNLNLLSGTFNNTGTITMASNGILTRTEGSIINNTPQAVTSYDIVYNVATNISTGSEIPSLATELRHVTKTGAATVTLTQPVTINGNLTFGNGIFDAGSNAIDLKGNLIANSTSVLTASPFTFSGTTNISGGSIIRFGIVTITGTLTPSVNIRIDGDLVNNSILVAGSGAQTTTFGGTSTISGSSVSSFNNVSITGTLNAPTGNMNVAGSWSNTGTFNAGVSTNTVTFNGTTTFTGAGLTQFSGITISGALTSSSTLRVAGNFTNNGTFNSNAGSLLLNGSSAQTISGTSPTTFNNITVTNVANPTSVQITSAQNLGGILTLSANTKFNAGNLLFTLLSSDDEPVVDAAIAALPTNAAVTGNVIIQRFMSIEGGSNDPLNNNGRIYRNISSPVVSPPVSDLQVEIPVTGSFTGTSACSGCGATQSMFLYRESEIGDTNGSGGNDFDDGYEDFPNAANSETLAPGRGYSVFVRGNIAPVSGAGNARFDLRGAINSGTINYVTTAGVTYTSTGTPANDGWNLVGNPYPSTIDWDAASGWTKTGLSNTIYMIDNGSAAGTYATYVGGVGGSNGGSRYIPTGQAFWVQATATPTFQSTESVKAAGNSTNFFREAAHPDLLSITLSDGSKRDEILVYFDSNTTDELDANGDALKLKNRIFNLSSVTPTGVKLAINGSASLVDCSKEIKLNVSDANPGIYQFELSQMDSFEDGVEISLIDKFLGTTIDAKNQATYQFEITDDEKSTAERFSLIFRNGIDNKIQSVTDGTSCQEGSVILTASGASENGLYRWYETIESTDPILDANASSFKTPSLTQTRNYYVAAVNSAGCEGERKVVKAEVVKYEEVVISEIETGILSSSYTTGNVWYLNDTPIPGATNQTLAVSESGVYKVETSIGNCKSTSAREYSITGLESELAGSGVSYYPNPVTDLLTVRVAHSDNINRVDLISSTGVRLESATIKNSEAVIDMRNHPAGLYLIKLIGVNNSVSTFKILRK